MPERTDLKPEKQTEKAPQAGHDARGRFAAGNPGGPGNPYARQVAQLRKIMLETVDEQDLREIVAALVERAKAGKLDAIKLLFRYLLGKPGPMPDPDRLDLDDQGPRLQQAQPAAQGLQVQQSITTGVTGKAELARCTPERPADRTAAAQPSANGSNGARPPSPNGSNGARAPSTNGDNGEALRQTLLETLRGAFPPS